MRPDARHGSAPAAVLAELNRRETLLPPQIMLRLREFLLDKRTGNVRLNIRDGVILGFEIEERVSLGRKS